MTAMRKSIPILLITICAFALILATNVSAANAPQLKVTMTVTATPMVTSTPTIQATPAIDPTVTALEKQKLQNETNWCWANSPALLSMLGVIAAVAVGFWQWRKQHDADQKKRHEDYLLEQAKLDEARFQSVVKGFESERIEARVGAAILLLTFLQKEYAKFYSQVFDLAVSLLRVGHVDPNNPESMDALSQALVIVLRRSFSLARGNDLTNFEPTTLDASRAQLGNAYLSMTDLRKIYMRDAYLRKAHFWASNLQKANFKHSNMEGAILGNANLEDANLGDTILIDANLSEANLNGAHFRHADLTGANFTKADLTNTRIENARSLQGTILRGVVGLSAEQLTACAAKGAIVDEVKIVEG